MHRPFLLGLTVALSALAAPAAPAQTAGQRLWAVDFESILTTGGLYTQIGPPTVGPDGTIYVGADSLYALEPSGRVRWTAPVRAGTIDVGTDGTVYTVAGRHTIYAFAPDGTLRWSYTEQPQGFGISTGPTVGPDGNVYAVSVMGGLGMFSLTPEGQLRWNVPGFTTSDGVEGGRVAFGPDNVYYADGTIRVAGCGAPHEGLVSVSLGGAFQWCHAISGIYDPPHGVVATLDGRALVEQRALPGIALQVYNPDGSLDWIGDLSDGVRVGPDNNLYLFRNSVLVSMTADGAQRWAVAQPINNFPWYPAIAPDLSAVVAGSNYGFGTNGVVIAADPADGQTLWRIPVTGPSAGAAGVAAFSPDGQVAYVPIGTLSFDEPDQLWAVQVREARPTAAEPVAGGDAFALAAPTPNPARGAARVLLTLGAAGAVRVEAFDALGRRVALLHDGPLSAGTHALALDAAALPAGAYVVRASGAGRTAAQRLSVAR